MNKPILESGFLGWSKFALDRHKEGTGHSFFRIPRNAVVERVKEAWDKRQPGQGETTVDRKVVVPVNPDGFFLSTTALQDDLPLKAEVVRRQPGEDPFVEVYVDFNDPRWQFLGGLGVRGGFEPAKYCSIVCYSGEALLENDGKRSTDCDWEIVCVIASNMEKEAMDTLTMARNFLGKAGGTKSIYTAEEFAEAIYYHSQRVKIKKTM